MSFGCRLLEKEDNVLYIQESSFPRSRLIKYRRVSFPVPFPEFCVVMLNGRAQNCYVEWTDSKQFYSCYLQMFFILEALPF